jgi:hypothetical protein
MKISTNRKQHPLFRQLVRQSVLLATLSAATSLMADAPAMAAWTGGGDRSIVSDAANWICYNDAGEVMAGAVPDAAVTVVTITGATSFNCPAGQTPVWKSLSVHGTVTLTADCDWRGLGSIFTFVAAATTINLKGNDLTVCVPNGHASRKITVTDDSAAGAGGAFLLEVAPDTTFKNGCQWNNDSAFFFNGTVEVVKIGAGAYCVGAAHSAKGLKFYAHSGGTTIREGTLLINNDAETTNDTTYYAQANRPVFGQKGSPITIEKNGTFDYRGIYDLSLYTIRLAGGTFTNTRWPSHPDWGTNGKLTFSDDSSIYIARTAHIGGPFELNGHTLTGVIAAGQTWNCRNGSASNGLITLSGSGVFHVFNPIDATDNVTVDIACPLTVAASFAVSNYIARYEGNANAGSGVMSVCGTFTPQTDGFYPVTIQNGATIDLSGKEGVWSSVGTSGRPLSFAADATVTIDVGSRRLAVGDKLISWPVAPGATFRLTGDDTENFSTTVATDGLYVRSDAVPAYAVRDLDAGGWKYFTDDGTDITAQWQGGLTSTIEVRFASLAEYDELVRLAPSIAPASYVLTALTLPDGSEPLDLSALDFRVASNVEIDTKGRRLILPVSAIGGGTSFTVTSSVTGGELVVDVPADMTLVNTAVALTGSLKLTKTGKGAFTPGREQQTYTGGTEVADGSLVCSLDGSRRALGPAGSAITVSADAESGTAATFDVKGMRLYHDYHFILNGGTFLNSSTASATDDAAHIAQMTLTADSHFQTLGDYGFINTGYTESRLDLGGWTLTVSAGPGKDFYLCNTVVENGTLAAMNGGWTLAGRDGNAGTSWPMRLRNGARFVCAMPLKLKSPIHVADGGVYQADYSGGWNYNDQSVSVDAGGVFLPGAHNYYRALTMRDGSILDLSRRTNALPATSAFSTAFDTYNRGGALSFAANARITVKIDPKSAFIRQLAWSRDADGAPDGLLVNWKGRAPADTVTFVLDNAVKNSFKLRRTPDGLVVYQDAFFVILK